MILQQKRKTFSHNDPITQSFTNMIIIKISISSSTLGGFTEKRGKYKNVTSRSIGKLERK